MLQEFFAARGLLGAATAGDPKLAPPVRGALEAAGDRGDAAAVPTQLALTPARTLVPAPASSRHLRRAETKVLKVEAETARERHTRLLQRTRKADEKRLAEVHAKLAAQGVPFSVRRDFMFIPRNVWVAAQAILADESGHAARIHLRRLHNHVAAGAIRRAALSAVAGGAARYAWSHERARAIAALGVALVMLGRRTLKAGQWEFEVKGVPQGALLALLRNPWTGERPHRNALTGTHRAGAQWFSGQVGWLQALRGGGLLYTLQMPSDDADACELIGPSGFATNRYLLVTDQPTRPLSDAEKWRLLELHAEGLEIPYGSRQRLPGAVDGTWRAVQLAAAVGPPSASSAAPA